MPSVPGGDKQKKTLIIVVAIVVGLSVLGWVGSMVVGGLLSFGMKKAIEAQTGVKIDERGGTVSFQGKDGKGTVSFDGGSDTGVVKVTDEQGRVTTITGDSGTDGAIKKLPAAFPADFPVYSGAAIDSTFSSESAEGSTFMVSWKSADAREKAVEFYKSALKSSGWNVTTTTESGTDAMIIFERASQDPSKKDGGWVTVSLSDGTTQISVSLTLVK